MTPAPLHELGHHHRHRSAERSYLVVGERGCSSQRVDAGSPQQLIGNEIADTGDVRLIQQPRLDRDNPAPHSLERLRVDIECIEANPRKVRIELDSTQPARIVDRQAPTIRETHGEPVPLVEKSMGAVLQVAHSRHAVDDQRSGHAKAQTQNVVSIRIEQQQLADSTGGHKCRSDQMVVQLVLCGPPLQEPLVAGRDLGDRSTQRRLLRVSSVVLDFGQLRHALSL
jgi:hypothetical protein